ncbi:MULTISPECIES: coiled-coil domain-containing protein [unclassified Rhizobium]|uniref:coiled-coil domain-containing protein n=1 Tax=unclassified Rhizobium TaxID=2613769 RepID=UPI001782009F|nr:MULTISPECIES: AAA family ATPase [unclassified Rhizobium]MBD8687238.1 AAA family ATPase [Rhizobium sp. CFBP 13644]MBD8690959.1 AAA family ATPase [Rhizobium sp. CFBP 13717]
MNNLFLRYLGYYGPGRQPAEIEFVTGLNVICGASETGKSFIAESVDFMLGRELPERSISEQVGYDRIRLAIDSSDGRPLTIDRSTEGGDFLAYDELLTGSMPTGEQRKLRWKHAGTRTDTLSFELLDRLGYAGRRLRQNSKGKTRSISFRDVARLCVATEGDIQRKSSPALSGQFVTATAEYAAFKLLLTGVDDSSLVSLDDDSPQRQRDDGKVELLDQMIAEMQAELDEAGVDENELREQEEKLTNALNLQAKVLLSAQAEFDGLLERRGTVATVIRSSRARMKEIEELVARFNLLDTHYKTDIERLGSIYESGSFLVHLTVLSCSVCGAHPGAQHLESDCDGNVEAVVNASRAEIAKIERLRRELSDTLEVLRKEHRDLGHNLPAIATEYRNLESQLSEIVSPSVADKRTSFNELTAKLAAVRGSLGKLASLARLMERKRTLVEEEDVEGNDKQNTKTVIPKSVQEEFAKEVQQILLDWDYPEASKVFFDEGSRDLVISGKGRGSTGKGLRAITHAAFTIGLLQFCKERDLPHPGFVVLDSPLLAYWKPEGEHDDLRGTDLKANFYTYLVGMSKDCQVIVVENEHPPAFVDYQGKVSVFTKNPMVGRYGFFPV